MEPSPQHSVPAHIAPAWFGHGTLAPNAPEVITRDLSRMSLEIILWWGVVALVGCLQVDGGGGAAMAARNSITPAVAAGAGAVACCTRRTPQSVTRHPSSNELW